MWDQNDVIGPNPGGVYDYGTVWNSTAIDAGTTRQEDTYGHGTHVAGIAAGNGRAYGGTVAPYTFVGVAPEADLVIVNTDFSTGGVIDAVQWIQEKATAMGAPVGGEPLARLAVRLARRHRSARRGVSCAQRSRQDHRGFRGQ